MSDEDAREGNGEMGIFTNRSEIEGAVDLNAKSRLTTPTERCARHRKIQFSIATAFLPDVPASRSCGPPGRQGRIACGAGRAPRCTVPTRTRQRRHGCGKCV